VILTPSRELAARVETMARDYSRFTDLKIGIVFGGTPIQAQERVLAAEPVQLLVATPGRLLELHARQALSFEDVEMLVLDEADRMVCMGLALDLKRILKILPETRQTLVFTGSMPPELNRVSKEALVEPIRVDLGPPSQPAAGITEAIYPVPTDLKADLLDEMLSRGSSRMVIVFTRNQASADRLAKHLSRAGRTVATLYGNRSQTERDRALSDLKRGRTQILVATDIASRAIDVDGIPHVVNFDVPPTPEDYVHRLGRGGRMATTGDAFTLMSPTDQEAVGAIERFMGRAVPRVLLPDFDYKMRPTEIKKVVSWDDGTARPAERAAAPVISARRPVPAPTRPAPAVRRSPAGRAKKPKPTRPSRARA
jgi:ATP-dependent RNA helicase RhlE